MNNLVPQILIGDADDKRFDRLNQILQDKFSVKEPQREQNFEDVERKLQRSNWNILFLADNLPEETDSKIVNLASYVERLKGVYRGPIVLIVSGGKRSDPLEGVAHYIALASSTPGKKYNEPINKIIEKLKVLGPLLPERPKSPNIKRPDDPSLREQLRTLSNDRNLDDGIKNISNIVQRFFEFDKIDIEKLGQGKSGSRVFLIRPSRAKKDIGEHVLKLVPDHDRWKLEREVERHNKAREHLAKGSIKSFLPELIEPSQPYNEAHPQLKYAVFYGRWYAICYELLGGNALGRVLDLEKALLENSDKITALLGNTYITDFSDVMPLDEVRSRILKIQLDCLCDLWYQNAKLAKRRARPLWSYEDREPDDYPSLPPYKLTGKNKGFVLNFLDSQAAEMGKDFFEEWSKWVDIVRSFLERNNKKSPRDKLLKSDSVVITSPVHGDLNCNNLLLWVEQKDHPLLIDFPMYQEDGHSLQDFAKLESEIKYVLMDRQQGSTTKRPQAFDYTYSQLPIWIEMENHLLTNSWDTPMPDFSQSDYKENVLFCLSLIQLVRKGAEKVQQQPLDVAPNLAFLDEYYPALLFHTLRAIGFESLSVFKRLLAVYSASRLIEKLS
jgi:hypothetical protein